jgi:beta-lactamase regulating signal transducer with metallopeptidase domain
MTMTSDALFDLFVRQIWQVACVAVFVGAIVRVFGRRRPHLAYLLWGMVLVKAMVPPVWSSPSSALSWFGMVDRPGIERDRPLVGDTSAIQTPVKIAHDSLEQGATTTAAVSVSPTPSRERYTLTLQDAVLVIWGTGVLVIGTLISIRYVSTIRRFARHAVATPPHVNDLVNAICRRLGVKHAPNLLVTSIETGPLVCGTFRPSIVLSAMQLGARTALQLKLVLAHELVHIRRRDPVFALLQTIAQTIWWFHPAVWIASRQTSRQRERCCDCEVLSSAFCEPQSYAQCLIDSLRVDSRRWLWVAPVGLTSMQATKQRLEEIMNHRSRLFPNRRALNWIATIVAALLLLPASRSNSAPQESPAADSTTDNKVADTANEDSNDGAPKQVVKPPELMYLAWQTFKPNDSDPPKRLVWDRQGRTVSPERAAEILKETGFREFVFPKKDGNDNLPPLLFIFKVDASLSVNAVHAPIRIHADDKSVDASGGSLDKPRNGYTLVSSEPSKMDLPRWPDRISLDIKYAIENPQTIRSMTSIPDKPIEVAKGIEFEIIPTRRSEGKGFVGDLRFYPGKGDWTLHRYSADVYLHDRPQAVQGGFHAWHYPEPGKFTNPDYLYHESGTFHSREDMEKVIFTRQRFAFLRIDNIPVRSDLLPKEYKQ